MSEESPWIVDVDAAGFQSQVLEASIERPIVLDFWAEWCEPCKELGPELERRAREGDGRFTLAKVDIDKNPELAQALQVRGIPAVFAVHQGRMVDGFEGALPPEQLDAFLDRVAPGGPGTGGSGDLALAKEKLAEGDTSSALGLLNQHLQEHPDDQEAGLLWAELLLSEGMAEEAKAAFEELTEETRTSPEGRAFASRLDFEESAVDLDALRARAQAAPEDFDARFELGKALVAARLYEEGLEELLEAVRLDPAGRATEARAVMLEAFDVLGVEDPIANDFRFKLSLELFA